MSIKFFKENLIIHWWKEVSELLVATSDKPVLHSLTAELHGPILYKCIIQETESSLGASIYRQNWNIWKVRLIEQGWGCLEVGTKTGEEEEEAQMHRLLVTSRQHL